MIRFRLGQSWKRESSAAPKDSFGLDLDGVDVLAGASDEPLGKVVPELIDALTLLAREGAPFAQVSLTEAHLELALRRVGEDVELTVVSLDRPARLMRPPLKVSLAELAAAAIRCARALAKDLSEVAPQLAKGARHKEMLKKLAALERRPLGAPPKSEAQTGFGYLAVAPAPLGFGFRLEDPEDRLLEYRPKSGGLLGPLLCGGAVQLRVGALEDAWRAEGSPFLLAVELSRQAGEVAHAVELDEEELALTFGGVGPKARLRQREGKLWIEGRALEVDARALARAMFELGVSLAFALTTRQRSLAKNPYVGELVSRCREGLFTLKEHSPAEEVAPPARTRGKRRAGGQPLQSSGRLRRLRFAKLWEKERLGGETPGQLALMARGALYASPEMACAFTVSGELLFRRVATHGVASSPEGAVLCASAERVLGFRGANENARWVRDHDGINLGPLLEERQGMWITQVDGRGALAFSEITGRELWRIDPPRTQHGYLTLHGERVLLATDSGYLYGLDLLDGQIRYRMRSALPFLGPAVPWGKKMLAALGRGDRFAVFAADAHSGAMQWTRELPLTHPSQPLPAPSRVLVAGSRDGEGVVYCLNAKGEPLWERKLHLGKGPFALKLVGRGVVAVARDGGAALVGSDGRLEWRIGPGGDPLPRLVGPQLARGVLVVPGEVVRAVEPKGGEVLSELRAGIGLCDLKVDAKLNLYLLDETGTLKAYQLSSHFAVVSGKSR